MGNQRYLKAGAGSGSRWMIPLALLPVACAGRYEASLQRDVASERARLSLPWESTAPGTSATAKVAAGDLEQGLPAYVALALQNSPDIHAAFERWQASVLRVSRARRLPEPTLSFGFFLRSVETRVGPQQGRVSLQQSFPWPTKLTAGADAAFAQARAAQRGFEAQALVVKRRVANAYWKLWQIRRDRSIRKEHLEVLRSLSQTVHARLATGLATLADQQQVDLTASRLEDYSQGLDEAERSAAALLRAASGMRGVLAVPTRHPPPPASLPEETARALADYARAQPMIETFGLLAEAHESAARAEAADRLPSFTVGVDWIITGDASMADVADSGKDAVMVGAGLRLPLWQGSYADSVAASLAEARAQRAQQRARVDRALAELEASLSAVRNTSRRVRLYQRALIPQTESAYASVLGAYASGRGTIAQLLLAQRDLLELRVEFEQSRADHAQAWARLEQVTGRELDRAPAGRQDKGAEGPHE